MLLYLTIKKSNEINSEIIYFAIMNYIFLIAMLKFIERKHNMISFFNIYIYLIIIIDIGFTIYNYIQKYITNIKILSTQLNNKLEIDVSKNILHLSDKNKFSKNVITIDTMDFNLYPDEIINSNFDINKFNNELNKFNELIKNPIKSEKIKIIKKEKESETEIKKFNENINKNK
jgi:hypothetical protein